jgi:hypothetical protein
MTGQIEARMLDIGKIAPKMLDAALAVTAGQLGAPSPAQAFCRLAAGDAAATTYFRYELARQIATALLMTDRNVVAVYEEQEPVIEEVGAEPLALFAPLRMLVRVRWETATLRPLLRDLNEALAAALRETFGRATARSIDAVIVSDDDAWLVEGRAMLHRPRPQPLASRDDVPLDL